MFRIAVSDKFEHIISRLQTMVTNSYITSNKVPLPRHLVLRDIDQNVSNDLKAKLDSVYREKEITIVVHNPILNCGLKLIPMLLLYSCLLSWS